MHDSSRAIEYSPSVEDRLLAGVKRLLPGPLRAVVREGRALVWKSMHPGPAGTSLEDELPWCSSNVWERICQGYERRASPRVCEYGIGSSTLHHVRNLLSLNGSYIGIEHDPAWHAKVLNALLRFGFQEGWDARFESSVASASAAPIARDTTLILAGKGGSRVTATLRLRGYPSCGDPHGALLAEMPEYVRALQEPCDLIVVDGVVRKGCLDHVLGTPVLKQDGLLVLHDAGHGLPSWLGRPTVTGARDFQPEVRRMLADGGEIVHGTGYDNWPARRVRRTIGYEARSYPFEACFMIRRAPREGERRAR